MTTIEPIADPAPKKPAKKAKKKSNRKQLYALHTWVGFHLAALMSVILLTGTFAVVSNELDWLFQHDMRVSPDGEQVGWGEMERAAKAFAPNDALLSLAAMEGDHFAYRATMMSPEGARYFLHINQWTGEVTGTTNPLTIQRFLRDLHRYLFMPSALGLPIVTSLAFILAISLYTGLKTARNWTTLATRIRFDKGARIAMGDAHKAAGIWSMWLVALIIVTGVWYLAEFLSAAGGKEFEPERPSLSAERVDAFGPVIKDASVQEFVDAAEAALPGLTATSIFLPSSAGGAVRVIGRRDDILVRDRANAVSLDPVDVSVVGIQQSNDINTVAYLNELADPLHFGFFGGLPTKLIWFAFGLAISGLSLSGVWLTWKRLKLQHPSRAQFATLPILVLAAGFFSQYVKRYQDPVIPQFDQALGIKTIGDVQASAYLSATGGAADMTAARLRLHTSEGRVNVSSVSLYLDGDAEPVARSKVRAGKTATADVQLPADVIAGASTLLVTWTTSGGVEERVRWSLATKAAEDLAAGGSGG